MDSSNLQLLLLNTFHGKTFNGKRWCRGLSKSFVRINFRSRFQIEGKLSNSHYIGNNYKKGNANADECIDVAGLSNGIYFIHIENGMALKFLKRRTAANRRQQATWFCAAWKAVFPILILFLIGLFWSCSNNFLLPFFIPLAVPIGFFISSEN